MKDEGDAPSEWEAGPVVLRVLLDGIDRAAVMEVLDHLAAVNAVEAEKILGADCRELGRWLTFEAGWYEQRSLRFEVAATTERRAIDARVALHDLVDSVIHVARCTTDGLAAATSLLRDHRVASTASVGLVVFGHREPSEELTTDQVLAALGLAADTPIVLTNPEGAGVRYGLALAARQGLDRIRARDERGLPRRAPADAERMRRLFGLLPGPPSRRVESDPVGATLDRSVTPTPTPIPDTPKATATPALPARTAPDRPAKQPSSPPPARVDPPTPPAPPARPATDGPGREPQPDLGTVTAAHLGTDQDRIAASVTGRDRARFRPVHAPDPTSRSIDGSGWASASIDPILIGTAGTAALVLVLAVLFIIGGR